ncbi:DUF2461 domain-containing protein [Microcella alkaliphila]|uniref:TIGR02453 family protein n=1 Tax=Microcella alkaliphila TaxID=279828 RepID=A0A0U4WV87_9MICO|nr:DUF2461 domain-containing protein [Microcella alkaliphila]BAU31767.1 TIGR02453 family protein [Microcella alkaliphila]
MTFAGFHPDAPRFYAELAENNTREWWQANKARYAETVRGPVEQLADVLGAEFGPVKIFRPHRDVRFSADKRPIKDHIGFVTTPADGTALHGQLNEHGLMLAGGVYQPSRDQLRRFRALVDDNRLVGDLEATLEELEESGFTIMREGALATAPRGYPREHPKIALLQLTSLAIARTHPIDDWMFGAEALGRILQGWRLVSDWNAWLVENIGPAVDPAAAR